MKKIAFLFLALCITSSLSAQIDNSSLYDRIRPADSLRGELHWHLNNFNFVRNYEYSNKFQDGYTLFGSQFENRLVYYAHPNFVLSLGAYLRKDYGAKGIYDAQPLFTATYQKNDLSLNFGVLEGNLQHGYLEALYGFDNKINQPLEYGTQLILNKKNFHLDTWIAWQQMIYPGDSKKEQIAGGFSAEILLLKDQNWRLSLPLQTYAFHAGGQIDVLKNVPISTLFNSAVGIKSEKYLGNRLKSVTLEAYFLGFKDFSPVKQLPFQAGNALWLNAALNTSFGQFGMGYWQGNYFWAPKASPLLRSLSTTVFNAGFVQKQRSLLMFNYVYQKELLPKLYLDVRFEPHFDLLNPTKNMQFNHSFFLSYRDNIRLFKRLKP